MSARAKAALWRQDARSDHSLWVEMKWCYLLKKEPLGERISREGKGKEIEACISRKVGPSPRGPAELCRSARVKFGACLSITSLKCSSHVILVLGVRVRSQFTESPLTVVM